MAHNSFWERKKPIYTKLKQIVNEALKDKSIEQDEMGSIMSKFLAKRKLLTISKMDKVNKNFDIFRHLGHFVDASTILQKIKKDIDAFVEAEDQQQQKEKPEAIPTNQQQKPLRKGEDLLREFDRKIKQGYGKKLQRRNEEYSSEIGEILKHASINFDKILPPEDDLVGRDKEKSSEKAVQKFPIKKLHLNSRKKHKASQYFSQALNILAFALRQKKKELDFIERRSCITKGAKSRLSSTNGSFYANIKDQSPSIRLRGGKKCSSLYVDSKKRATFPQNSSIQTDKTKLKFQHKGENLRYQKKNLKGKTPKKITAKAYYSRQMNNLLEKIQFERDYNEHNKKNFNNYFKSTKQLNRLSEEESKILIKQIENQVIEKTRRTIHHVVPKSKKNLG